ncbi:Uncharacterised protein [Serratia entomophila]|nr:Uncharacterised protein [Serratia entomophila]
MLTNIKVDTIAIAKNRTESDNSINCYKLMEFWVIQLSTTFTAITDFS